MLGSFVGIADYGAFVVAIIVFLLIPGPGNLALITSTSKGGIAGGLGATFGVIAGDQVLLWAAVAGVSAIMAAYPTAFHLVQWAGANRGWSVLVYNAVIPGQSGGPMLSNAGAVVGTNNAYNPFYPVSFSRALKDTIICQS